MTIALGRAARRHILVKGGEVFEVLSRPGVMLLDKTGTLTAGQIAVVSWRGDERLRPLVAALERHSAHPIAKALSACSTGFSRNPDGLPPEGGTTSADEIVVADVRQTIGGGITGIVAGRRIVVGSLTFVRERGIEISADIEAAVQATIAETSTPVLVAVNRRAAAVAGLGDPLRPDAADAIDRLRKLGWRIRILSGDHPDVVAAVGRKLGIAAEDAIGGASPEDKLKAVRATPVVMVGDGVNDAAALSAAAVGIAVHGGAEASLAAAHVYLDRPGLTPILELISAARATLRAVRRCFAASILYNSLAGILAVTGLISPLAAAILMPISSFTVFALAYSARTFGDKR